jgi:Domain of unknown function (DUF1906)
VQAFGFSAARSVERMGIFLAGIALGVSAVQAADYCGRPPQGAAVDLSAQVNTSFLDKMRQIGVNTIIRYYDYEDETLPGKTLTRAERDLIAMNGFTAAVVFQHHNDRFASFSRLRGRQDAERSLALANAVSQAKGSAIYFGVDGGWHSSYELANITAYFSEVKATLAGSGYRVGVYGSGLVCDILVTNGLAELCWLGAPTSWPGYSDYYQTRRWRLAQLPTSECGGRSVDFNLTNGMNADYGQFGY